MGRSPAGCEVDGEAGPVVAGGGLACGEWSASSGLTSVIPYRGRQSPPRLRWGNPSPGGSPGSSPRRSGAAWMGGSSRCPARSRRCGHVGDDVGWFGGWLVTGLCRDGRDLAGLRDVDLVAVPEQVVALGRPAGVCVIRRGQALSARRETVCIGLPPSVLPPVGVSDRR